MAKNPKKQKPIPSDLISYIQNEGNAIKTARDKDLILGYARNKLKLVEWHIQMLNCKSEDYIIPQSHGELTSIKNQLTCAITEIERTPLPPPKGTIQYPSGYEG